MRSSDSMDSTETQSGRSVSTVREEIVLLRMIGGESDNVISKANGSISMADQCWICRRVGCYCDVPMADLQKGGIVNIIYTCIYVLQNTI